LQLGSSRYTHIGVYTHTFLAKAKWNEIAKNSEERAKMHANRQKPKAKKKKA